MIMDDLRLAVSLKRAKVLTTEAREHIADKNFALPNRRYPISDRRHGANALARVSQFGTPEEKATVRAKVHAKYPDMGEHKEHAEKAANAAAAANAGQAMERLTPEELMKLRLQAFVRDRLSLTPTNAASAGMGGAMYGAMLGAPMGAIAGASRGNTPEGIGRGLVRGGMTGGGAALGGLLGHNFAPKGHDSLASMLGALAGGAGGWIGSGKLIGEPSGEAKPKKDKEEKHGP